MHCPAASADDTHNFIFNYIIMFDDNIVREYLATNIHGDINNIKLQVCIVNMGIYFMF